MRELVRKEMKLSASPLSFFFIAFGLMFFLPGYPVLCGAFFVSLGIYQSFQNAREANDLVFSALLPVAKRDVVKGKYLFSCLIELCAFAVMAAAAFLRMTLLSDVLPYRNNALMNANPFAAGMALLIFALFNCVFIGGFFKTAYKLGRPFIFFTVSAFVTIGIGEALHYFPGLEALNAFAFDRIGLQLLLFAVLALLSVLLTLLSCQASCRNFEKIDL